MARFACPISECHSDCDASSTCSLGCEFLPIPMAGWKFWVRFATPCSRCHSESVWSSTSSCRISISLELNLCGSFLKSQKRFYLDSVPKPSGRGDRALDKENWLPADSRRKAALVDELRILCKGEQLEKALDVLFRMDQLSIVPPIELYRSLLKECSKRKALAQAKRVHAHLARNGLESTRFLGESVVSALVKCGGLKDAVQVFRKLPSQTVVSWTALISGYTNAGQGQKALKVYYIMRQKGVDPDKYTFVSLLKACGSTSNLEEGKRIHAEAVKHRCASDMFVGTCLLEMYSKCGSIGDAQDVFESLAQRDIVLWRAMLTAYAQQGLAGKALQLYDRMLNAGVSPDDQTFVSVLQVCSKVLEGEEGSVRAENLTKAGILRTGKAVQSEAWKRGYKSSAMLSSTLITVFGKCGSICDAQHVFDRTFDRDVVTWTAMLGAYSKQSQPEKALELYMQMLQQGGVNPDGRTFAMALQAGTMVAEKEDSVAIVGQLTKPQSLQRGKAIHAEACRTSYGLDVVVSNALISMYGKCGSFVDAESIFEQLSQRDSVSWNAMVGACALQGNTEKALQLYESMLEEGISPNHRTLASVLHACSIHVKKDTDVGHDRRATKGIPLQKGKVIHAEAWKRGYKADVFIGSSLVSMYSKCGSIQDAENVFNGLSQWDAVAYNAMLSAYTLEGKADKALELYEKMLEEGRSPDAWTFVSVLQACGTLATKGEVAVSLHKGKLVHANALKAVYQLDVFVGNILISMYGQCGSIPDAEQVFNGLSQRNVVSWNAMLTAYAEQGQGVKALQLFGQMLEEGLVSPDETILISVLKSCGQTGALDLCIEIHSSIVSTGNDVSFPVASALIHAYSQCAKMVEAQRVFDSLSGPDLVCWTALIAGYARQGDWTTIFHCYEKMCALGVKPNGVTFLSLLSACSHAGMVSKGVEYFESMNKDHGIAAGIEHYVSLVDLFGRAGHLKMVEELLLKMPMQPNLSAWLCLLGACRKHGNVMLARWAFDHAVLLQPKDAAAYSLMSSIYAQSGMWELARQVNDSREKAGAWKKPGESWIGHEQEVNTFVAGDWQYPHGVRLYELLAAVSVRLIKEVALLHRIPGAEEPSPRGDVWSYLVTSVNPTRYAVQQKHSFTTAFMACRTAHQPGLTKCAEFESSFSFAY